MKQRKLHNTVLHLGYEGSIYIMVRHTINDDWIQESIHCPMAAVTSGRQYVAHYLKQMRARLRERLDWHNSILEA